MDDGTRDVKRGRPADVTIDAALARAARSLLAAQGWTALTVQRVAERAGVARASAYRRCRTPHDLLLLAMGDIYEQVPVPDTGTLRGDLVAMMDDVVAVWRDPAHVHLLAAIVAAQDDDARLQRAYAAQFAARRSATTEIVRRAVARGELAGDGDLLLDLLAGVVAQIVLLRREPLADGFSRRVVEALLTGFAA